MQMPVILLCIASLVFSSASLAQPNWEQASLVEEQPTAPGIYRCFYETLGGYRFSIIISGPCPLSVTVNPETGQVKQE